MDLTPTSSLAARTGARDTPMFRPLGRRKAYEEVADQIVAHIAGERLEVSRRLPTERELAAQFGVSRVVVREAIRVLELRGLLKVRKGPKGGIFVARDLERPILDSIASLLALGDAALEDLFEVRQLIEPHAAARVARIGTESDLESLRELVDEADRVHAAGGSIREINIELHCRIIRMAGNPVLAAVGETVLVLLARQLEPVADRTPSDDALKMHKKLLVALRKRDAARARQIMSADIASVGKSYSQLGRTRFERERNVSQDEF
ncbi:MAG: FadR family transcriptional regulator [Burkholderiales bacterium]|nr:FadR family transcriptional regulator [Burkholderiales bacterium]